MTQETEIKKAIKDYFRWKHVDWFYNLQAMGSYAGIPIEKKTMFKKITFS